MFPACFLDVLKFFQPVCGHILANLGTFWALGGGAILGYFFGPFLDGNFSAILHFGYFWPFLGQICHYFGRLGHFSAQNLPI